MAQTMQSRLSYRKYPPVYTFIEMSDESGSAFARRNFLLNAAVAGVVPLLAQTAAAAPQSTGAGFGTNDNPGADNFFSVAMTTESPGADFMVDAIKSLGFEYICANPGSSYRGLHESIVAYGG